MGITESASTHRERGRAADEGCRPQSVRASGCDHDPLGLPAWPASIRTVLAPLGAGRPRPCPVTCLSAQERHTLGPPPRRHRTARLAPPPARARAKPLSILERAGSAYERRWLPPDDYEAWEGRQDAIQRASAHAPPRLRVQTCQ